MAWDAISPLSGSDSNHSSSSSATAIGMVRSTSTISVLPNPLSRRPSRARSRNSPMLEASIRGAGDAYKAPRNPAIR